METMNKFAAMQALMNGEISEMISPDGKHKYAMVDGSIVTPRKKALDMKDMMQEGWLCRAMINWKDHIGTGILCVDKSTGKIPTLVIGEDKYGPVSTAECSGDWDNLRPMTAEEGLKYIFSPDAIEKAKNIAENSPTGAIKESKNPAKEPKEELEIQEEATPPSSVSEEAERGNDLPPQQTSEPTALQKEDVGDIASSVRQRARYFETLGVEKKRFPEFVSHFGITEHTIEEFATRDISEILKDIQSFMGN